MPIEGVSEIRRFPVIDKIRLGVKKEGDKGPYPSATAYFVCPQEVQDVYGPEPTELGIFFPSNDMEIVAPQYLKCYGSTWGMICKGTGKTCRRKVDDDTGNFADKDTKSWHWEDGNCNPEHCQKVGAKQCRRVMSLVFIIRNVPGAGVYRLDTTSWYSIVNVNSFIAPGGFLRPLTASRTWPEGRISFIPLLLTLVPQEIIMPGGGRKTVYILSIKSEALLTDLIEASRTEAAQVLLPKFPEDEVPSEPLPPDVIEVEGDEENGQEGRQAPPEDARAGEAVHPNQKAAQRARAARPASGATVPPANPAEAEAVRTWQEEIANTPGAAAGKPPAAEQPWLDVKEADIKSMTDVFRFCSKFFKVFKNGRQVPMSSTDVLKELGYTNMGNVSEPPWQCWRTIVSNYGEKE